eukprot:2567142-Pleurochrysis_carterae.AAC.1
MSARPYQHEMLKTCDSVRSSGMLLILKLEDEKIVPALAPLWALLCCIRVCVGLAEAVFCWVGSSSHLVSDADGDQDASSNWAVSSAPTMSNEICCVGDHCFLQATDLHRCAGA